MKNTMTEGLKKLSQGQVNESWAGRFGRVRCDRLVSREEEEGMSVKEVEGRGTEGKGLDYKAMRALVERCVKRGWVKRLVAKIESRKPKAESRKRKRVGGRPRGGTKHSTLNIQRRTSKWQRERKPVWSRGGTFFWERCLRFSEEINRVLRGLSHTKSGAPLAQFLYAVILHRREAGRAGERMSAAAVRGGSVTI